MSILFPEIVLLLTALTLLFLRFMRPNFKYTWMIAIGGAILAFGGILFWQLRLPQSISVAAWQPETLFNFSPTWRADGVSWPYAISLATLALGIIWTSVVRSEKDPAAWAATLLLTALGILAVAAENPLTLILVWSAIDLVELFAMLRSTDGEQRNLGVVISFAARLTGTGLVVWANLLSTAAGTPMNFQTIPEKVGIFLLIAAGLRLGVFPLHLPYLQENVLRRGFGTALRLISAVSSLILLARIPISAVQSSLQPYLIILAAFAALYAGWMWLRAPDEIFGRPFWVLAIASLAVGACLRGNPIGSIGWGIVLILSGGSLFLFSARQRNINWLPLVGLWGLTALPFSPTASVWQTGDHTSWLLVIPFLPAQALLLAGAIRQVWHPGETSLESNERWTKFLYPIGLLLFPAVTILLGLWGWNGAHKVGQWWTAVIANCLAAGFTFFSVRILPRSVSASASNQWTRILRVEWLYKTLAAIYDFFCRIFGIITSSLEGEGGLLWSLLLLALIISILSTQIR